MKILKIFTVSNVEVRSICLSVSVLGLLFCVAQLSLCVWCEIRFCILQELHFQVQRQENNK